MERICLTLPTLALTAAAAISTPVLLGGQRVAAGGTVFVTERERGTVTAFDGDTGDRIWTASTGASPIGVVMPAGTGRVYTSNEGSNSMSVVDAATGDPLPAIPMGPLPHHLMASANGNYIYVAEFGHNQVGVVDTTAGARVDGFIASPLANARTHAVWITTSGRFLYATNSRANRAEPGDVAKLDARTGALLCNTTVGADPSEILVTPDGNTGYVSVRRENKVKELDLRGDCPELTGREAQVGPMPDTLQLANDGATLIVTLRGTPAQISFLDLASFVAAIVPIAGHTTTGHHWLTANGRYTYVAVEGPGGLAVVDNRTGDTVADYPYPAPPGGNRAHGVFYVPRRVGQ